MGLGPERAFIALVGAAAAATAALTAPGLARAASHHPAALAAFAAFALALQLAGARSSRRASISVSGVGMLAAGFALGVGAGLATAVLCALAHAVRTRGRVDRAFFNAASFALATAGATAAYELAAQGTQAPLARVAAAGGAGALFWAINIGALSLAIGVSERSSPVAIWVGRFRWLTVHYWAFGPLALATAAAYGRLGVGGLVVVALAPGSLGLSVRRYVDRLRAAGAVSA
jgi:hypothetical protein